MTDWNNAPPWANYRTQDWDGQVNYWEVKPVPLDSAWWFPDGITGQWGRDWDARRHGKVSRDEWRNSLDARPQAVQL